MDQITLQPVSKISGEVTLPGSKSLTNRALLLAALAEGETRIVNLLSSADTGHMITALRQLGVEITDETDSATVVGNGGLFPTPENGSFFLGNAGTAIRPLTAMLSLIPGQFIVDGDQYMRERPIAHLGDALKQLGASIEYTNKEGFPPIVVDGGHIEGGSVDIAGRISSQYLTALLLSLPLAENDSTINVIGEQVSKPYLDITLGIMKDFGVTVQNNQHQQFQIPGKQTLLPRKCIDL